MKLTVITEAVRTTIARTIRRAAVTAAAPARAYRAFVIDRARDDISYTSRRARRTYRATWGPRRRHRRLGDVLAHSIRHDLREDSSWTC